MWNLGDTATRSNWFTLVDPADDSRARIQAFNLSIAVL